MVASGFAALMGFAIDRRTALPIFALGGASCFAETFAGSAPVGSSGAATGSSGAATGSDGTSGIEDPATSSTSDDGVGSEALTTDGEVTDTSTSTTATGEVQPGMVLLYDFEDAEISIPDRSPNGLDGFIAGTPVVTDDGRFGRGVSFPGGVAWLETPAHPLLDLADAFTFEAWVRLGNVGIVGLFDKGCCDATATNYHVNVAPSGVAQNYVVAGACVVTDVETGITAGVWAHVAVTFDGATLRYFVDAVEVAAASCSGPLPVNGTALTIGQWPYLEGTLDDIAVFDHARTADQICDDARGAWNGTVCDLPE